MQLEVKEAGDCFWYIASFNLYKMQLEAWMILMMKGYFSFQSLQDAIRSAILIGIPYGHHQFQSLQDAIRRHLQFSNRCNRNRFQSLQDAIRRAYR